MEVQGLSWMGVRVSDLAAAVAFFEALGLERDHAEGEMVAFTAKNGDTVEVFGPGDADHRHFDSGPVVGLQVEDVDAARRELQAGGVEFAGPTGRGAGMVWAHFRGPDGMLYELTARE
jgi:catechol 2,3-dioxygenase-like lactoylglutathione lyase family enzyme